MRYNEYHKHDHISNIFTPDVNVKPIDYIKRAIELGHDTYFTTNHGSGGDIFEAFDLCSEYGLHCKYCIEGYIVKDPLSKDKRNYHIILMPKTNKARKKLNIITSRANTDGFYYKPRIFLDDLLKLDKEDLFITNACIGGILKDEDGYNEIFVPLVKHFGSNFLLEIQNHKDALQVEQNKLCLKLSKEFNLKLVVANDSHYIYPEQAKERDTLLLGKHVTYDEEDSYLLDYPDYNTLKERFIKQGVFTEEQIEEAIRNTLIFDTCEDIYIDKETVKMPSIYKTLSPDEKIDLLREHLDEKFKAICLEEDIYGDKLEEYKTGIAEEFQVIIDTKEINTADYFLFNEKNVDLAVNKYGGVLTRTGRGSCGGFYINKILGLTQLDRFQCDIPLYPERFMSTARLLDNRAMPDIDYNVVDPEPFVKASRELLGEHNCYPMVAYGTMKESEAFRNICRSYNMDYDEFNNVAKNIDDYRDDKKWKKYIEESQKFVGTIISVSVHPCAYLLLDESIIEEFGIVKCGENYCVLITSPEADNFRFLKNDYLTVAVWKLISETFNMINKPIMTVHQLMNSLDDKVWSLFEHGLTCTLNQCDGDWATALIKEYKPRNYIDTAMFTACLRPFFNSWRDSFISRMPYTTGSVHLDKLLSPTNHYLIFQENLMQYFEWLGVSPAKSIGLIKKISKKKIKQKDFDDLEEKIKTKWIENTGSIDMFYEIWKLVQECMSYGFCSAHGLATGDDMLYGAYLKANYPFEYYTVCLNNYGSDEERTKKLTEELKFFNISLNPPKFRYSNSKYMMDKNGGAIYKGLASIKYLNEKTSDELYQLRDNKYNSFIALLIDIKDKTSCNSRQLQILAELNFFSEFGDIKYILKCIELFNDLYGKKQFKKDKLPCGLSQEEIEPFSHKTTPKTFAMVDTFRLLTTLSEKYKDLKSTSLEIALYQQKNLGYIDVTDANQKGIAIATSLDTKYSPKASLYALANGSTIEVRVGKKLFNQKPFKDGSVLRIKDQMSKPQQRMNEKGEWVEIPNTKIWWLIDYDVLPKTIGDDSNQ